MGKWNNLIHRFEMAVSSPWFLSLEKDLRRLDIGDPKTVFDVGAHLGQTSLHFRKVFRNAFIHAFEPVPQNFQQLVRNVGKRDRLYINKTALGSSIGEAFIKEGFSDLTHSIVTSGKGIELEGKEKISLDTVDEYMTRHQIKQIDLLKIDTEGHEIEVLEGAKGAIQRGRIAMILTECDFCKEDKQHTYFPDLMEYLSKRGFAFFGLYDVFHYGESYGIGHCDALFLNKDE